METYKRLKPCIKCGDEHAKSDYVLYFMQEIDREQIKRKCSNCGYEWAEKPLDRDDIKRGFMRQKFMIGSTVKFILDPHDYSVAKWKNGIILGSYAQIYKGSKDQDFDSYSVLHINADGIGYAITAWSYIDTMELISDDIKVGMEIWDQYLIGKLT